MQRSTRSRATSSTPTDQLAYDVFEYQTKDTLRGASAGPAALSEALPMNHFYGIHTEYPTIASGQGGAPFNNSRITRTA